MTRIEIRYWRPPAKLQTFAQELVVDRSECKVTLVESSTSAGTLSVGEKVIFEPGAPMIWYVFPGKWYDLGRFYLRDGTFTGYYGNIIAPATFEGTEWEIYDLCLDLWIDRDGTYQILDQDEFDEAVDRHWIDAETARRARLELDRLVQDTREGRFPPPIACELDLERVRELQLSGD
jgi:predicted RNA-binding protein associated with RNAse of E/G family